MHTMFGRSATRVSAIVLVPLLFSIGCGGDSKPTGPIVSTVTVTGIVRSGAAGAPVAGATVTIGSVSVTSGQDGRFTFQNLTTTGAVSIQVSAPGHVVYVQSITLQGGSNTHDVALVRSTIFSVGDYNAYLPPAVTTYRGVLFMLAGSTGDSRAFVGGEASCFGAPPGIPCPNDADFRLRLGVLAEKYGLAIFGAKTGIVAATTYLDMLAALESVSQQSGRPEIATAPVLLVGSSLGGCIGQGFTRLHAQRSIGFMTAKGNCHVNGVSPAREVPGYLFVSEEDPVSPDELVKITELFVENRAEGLPWALALEPNNGHAWPRRHDVTTGWMDAVLAARLPPATGANNAPLRTIAETSGWLGSMPSFQIAMHACYGPDKLKASWLPNEQTARDWQKLVTDAGSTTVRSCP